MDEHQNAVNEHSRQWRRVGRGGICSRAPAEGAPKGDAESFLRHEIYKNSASSGEAGIGTEGQIMCVKQCTF